MIIITPYTGLMLLSDVVGDQILEWNGLSLTGLSYEEVQAIIANPNGEIELVVRPYVLSENFSIKIISRNVKDWSISDLTIKTNIGHPDMIHKAAGLSNRFDGKSNLC